MPLQENWKWLCIWVIRFLTRVTHVLCRSISELKGLPGRTGQGNHSKCIFNLKISTRGIFGAVTAEQARCAPCLSVAAQEVRKLGYRWALQGHKVIFQETQRTWNFLIPLLVPVVITSGCLTSPAYLSADTIRKGNVLRYRHRIMWAVSLQDLLLKSCRTCHLWNLDCIMRGRHMLGHQTEKGQHTTQAAV